MFQLHAFDPAELQAEIQGRVVVGSDRDYDELRAGFNGMIDKRPVAIVRATGDADVAAAIRAARTADLPLAIRAGGHSAPGFGCCDDGIVIDCRELGTSRSTPRGDGPLRQRPHLGRVRRGDQRHGLATTGGACPARA